MLALYIILHRYISVFQYLYSSHTLWVYLTSSQSTSRMMSFLVLVVVVLVLVLVLVLAVLVVVVVIVVVKVLAELLVVSSPSSPPAGLLNLSLT